MHWLIDPDPSQRAACTILTDCQTNLRIVTGYGCKITSETILKWIGRTGKTATLKIPLQNIFDKNAIKQIEQRVLDFHIHTQLLTAVQTARHPDFNYSFENKGNANTIRLHPKNPNYFEENPATITGRFKFDTKNDPESNACLRAVDALHQHGIRCYS